MKPSILDGYVARRFAAIYAASLVSFTLLYVLVDSVSQVNSLSAKSEGLLDFAGTWVRFYAAQVPILFCRVLGPVTAAAAATFTATFFQRSNEITAVLAAGVSLRRLLAPVVLLSGAATLASAAVQEVWVPARRIHIREARALGRGRTTAHNAMHLDSARRVLVVFRRYHLKELRGEGVLALSLKGRPGRSFILEAEKAHWVERGDRRGEWILENGFIQESDNEGRVVIQAPLSEPPGQPPRLHRTFGREPLKQLLDIEMIPSDLEERESQEAYLWMDELLAKVELAPDSARWRIRLYSRLADPLHGLILVLLGVPTILRRGTRNLFLSALATVAISALYFVAYTALLNLGNRGALSSSLAVGLAPLFFGALGATLYARLPS